MVKGKLHIQRDDYWGNRSIVNVIHVGEMFGEAYVSPGSEPILNDVIAVDNSTVIFFDVRKMLNVCSSACRFHSIVLQNLFLQYLIRTGNSYRSLDIYQSVPRGKN